MDVEARDPRIDQRAGDVFYSLRGIGKMYIRSVEESHVNFTTVRTDGERFNSRRGKRSFAVIVKAHYLTVIKGGRNAH